MTDRFVITQEWIEQHRTGSGGFTRKQLEAIDVSWPPHKGWARAAVGRQITVAQKIAFEQRRKARVYAARLF